MRTYGNLWCILGLLRLEKAMAPHSSTLAWRIPWTEEPGRLQSKGSWRVRHDWATSLSLFSFMHWRRKWQPTSVFLPGIFHGEESGGLQSMGSQSIRHNLATEHACMPLAIRVTVKYSGCFSIGGPSWFPWRQLKAWAFLRMGLKQPLLLSWKGIVAAAAAAS